MRPVAKLLCTSLTLGFVMALTAVPGSAQFGINGGLSLSDLVGSGVDQVDTRQGLTGGMGYTVLSIGPVSLGPEIHYVQKGSGSIMLDPEAGAAFDEFGLDYLEIPVILRLGFPLPVGDGAVRGYAEGGPAFAWRVNCAIAPTQEGGAQLSDECAFDSLDNVESVVDSADQGAIFGGGLIFRIEQLGGAVSLDGRLARGLSRLDGGGDLDARNRAFSLTLGYDFSF